MDKTRGNFVDILFGSFLLVLSVCVYLKCRIDLQNWRENWNEYQTNMVLRCEEYEEEVTKELLAYDERSRCEMRKIDKKKHLQLASCITAWSNDVKRIEEELDSLKTVKDRLIEKVGAVYYLGEEIYEGGYGVIRVDYFDDMIAVKYSAELLKPARYSFLFYSDVGIEIGRLSIEIKDGYGKFLGDESDERCLFVPFSTNVDPVYYRIEEGVK